MENQKEMDRIASEKENIEKIEKVRERYDEIEKIVQKVYKDEPVYLKMIKDFFKDGDNFEFSSRGEGFKIDDLIYYNSIARKLVITEGYFKFDRKTQKLLLLHAVADLYITEKYNNGEVEYHHDNIHEYVYFRKRYTQSLKFAGIKYKELTIPILEEPILTTKRPEFIRLYEEAGVPHSYYCPTCKDVFHTSWETFQGKHKHNNHKQ
jgi:hypothetical protein